MNNSNSIPRAQGSSDDTIDLKVGTFNKIADMVEANRLTVASGSRLSLQQMPGCTLISIAAGLDVRPLILRAPETGGGFYKGDWMYGSPVVAGGTANLSLPLTNMKSGTNSNVLVLNPSENNATGHSLSPTNGAEIYGAGLLIGKTGETPARDVAVLMGSPPPSVQFASVDATWLFGNHVNAHLMNGTNTTTNALLLAITMPISARIGATPWFFNCVANEVVAFMPITYANSLGATGIIISPNLSPAGTNVGQVPQITAVASGSNSTVWGVDYTLSHP